MRCFPPEPSVATAPLWPTLVQTALPRLRRSRSSGEVKSRALLLGIEDGRMQDVAKRVSRLLERGHPHGCCELGFDVSEDLQGGSMGRPCPVGHQEQLGAPVCWVWCALEVAVRLEVVDEFSHRLFGDAGGFCQIGEADASRWKVHHDRRVRAADLWEPGKSELFEVTLFDPASDGGQQPDQRDRAVAAEHADLRGVERLVLWGGHGVSQLAD